MTKLPEQFQTYSKNAASLLKKDAIGEIEFSGGTYQVQIKDPRKEEDCWSFLQFDEKNRLTDSFCSCESGGELGACVHLAAAYLRIFDRGDAPLHIRFHDSLWNHLCYFFADEYGDDPEIVKNKGRGQYSCLSNEEEIFTAKGLTAQGREHLKRIFLDRFDPTEETSLKFSNLSEEEIKQWKQGRPSSYLKYELSFWNDLAKWLMLLQDEGSEYKISFTYDTAQIPKKLSAQFEDATFVFVLNFECLNYIIPSLSTVNSPLKVFGKPEESIEKAVYDKEKGELKLYQMEFFEEDPTLSNKKGIILGNWLYFPKIGFYPRQKHALLEKEIYRGREIGKILDRYHWIIKSKLENVPIKEKPVQVSYSLNFDSVWNLHIEAYLYTLKDLSQPTSQFFGEWAYIESEGFIHLEGVIFDAVETIVTENELGEFIRQHRVWFNHQRGFRTHITGVETKLKYKLTEDNAILFTRLAVLEDDTTPSKDFGPWVYIKGQGFFSKVSANLGIPIRSGVAIKEDQVPLFIRMYRDELALIKGFFADKCPVAKAGLKIELNPQGTVTITPEYELYLDYKNKEVKFFEDYTYVRDEGFYRLPVQMLLPERFRHAIQLEKDNLSRFFAYEFDKLKEYALWIDPRLSLPEDLRLIADDLTLGVTGYALKMHYESEKGAVLFSDLWHAFVHKERFVFSNAGLIDLDDERYLWLRKLKKEQVELDANILILSTLELIRLNAFDPPKVIKGEEFLEELIEFRTPEEPDLTSLKSKLRPYQEIGLKWLWFLYHHNLSGLLCDDMGLGKTHQAMALMAAIAQKKEKFHFLVVCPTSVIYHWEEKLNEFLPKAKVCTFHGSNRNFVDFHVEYDILLTSYGIWRKENELLSKVAFEVAIFDEIQAAKNQTSRIHASLLNAKARIRIGLTGTPIENRLRELKALFDIILPSYMPSEDEYKQFFVVPIEKENNPKRRNLLTKFIKPFVLRRKKEDVLPDLPEKIEEISHCELSLDQKILYNDVLQKVRDSIYRELEDKNNPIPYIHIFSALSSLKQICNHPAAFLKIPQEFESYTSGKWDLFVELLSEALESKQKVVIFSQYLAMLDIFEKYFQDRNIEYATIRGATIKRGEEIRKFNHDPSCEVFIGSLQAAGLGIDLTAGSVVIHYDRWWNAAREDQATDRVHRIGQVRGVQVFKLVTKGTFEERIDAMITRKGKLMEEVVGVDDYRFMKHFDREEILQLFRDLPM
jgi:SNF2 family DNA or RNA helicase